MLPASHGSAFDQLKQLVDSEDTNLADPDWLGMLASIGIVKGQPFNPDATDADDPRSGREDRLQNEPRHRFRGNRRRPLVRVYPDRRWLNPIADGTPDNPAAVRPGLAAKSAAVTSISTLVSGFHRLLLAQPGHDFADPRQGAKYMIAFTDSEGTPLSGGSNYRLNLPPNIPAANFWSVTSTKPRTPRDSPTANLSHHWVARQACAERRRQHRPLSRAQSA